MSLSDEIREYALDLGYSRVGITSADAFPTYAEELKSRHEMYAWYIEGKMQPIKGAEPRSIASSARSIVTVVHDFFTESFPENLVGKIGRMYQARCFHTPRHRIHGARRQLMHEFLEKNGCEVTGRPVLYIPERLAAARAGATNYGKNTFAFAEGIGSFVVIHAFVVNVELDYDAPTVEVKCPPKCTACIDACPTGALYEPLKMDPRRCITYNSTQTQEGYAPGVSADIPRDIREKMGSWVHGCDVCQEVCPRNQRKLKAKLPESAFLNRIAADFDLPRLLSLTDEFYARRVQPLMYNYIKDKKYFQRNAAIAMGNSGDTGFVPDLVRAMQYPEGLVRGYAAWALCRLGGTGARQALESSLTRETDAFARKEILAALAAM